MVRVIRILDVKIRVAVAQDSEALVKLADELIPLGDWSSREAMLKKSLQDPDCKVIVAETDEKIVGFIESRVFPDFVEGAPITVIQSFIVDKNYRKRGIGSQLLQKACEEAVKQKAKEIHVWTEFENQQPINLYAKHGFKKRALLLEKET